MNSLPLSVPWIWHGTDAWCYGTDTCALLLVADDSEHEAPRSRPHCRSLSIFVCLFWYIYRSLLILHTLLSTNAGLFAYLYVSFFTFMGLFWLDTPHPRPHRRSLSIFVCLFWYIYRSLLTWHDSLSTPLQVSFHIYISVLIQLQVLFEMTRLTLDPSAGLFAYWYVSFDTFTGLIWHDTPLISSHRWLCE